MRDFNLVKAELIQHLEFSTQADDGTIYWYEGTVPLLCEMLAFNLNFQTNYKPEGPEEPEEPEEVKE